MECNFYFSQIYLVLTRHVLVFLWYHRVGQELVTAFSCEVLRKVRDRASEQTRAKCMVMQRSQHASKGVAAIRDQLLSCFHVVLMFG